MLLYAMSFYFILWYVMIWYFISSFIVVSRPVVLFYFTWHFTAIFPYLLSLSLSLSHFCSLLSIFFICSHSYIFHHSSFVSQIYYLCRRFSRWYGKSSETFCGRHVITFYDLLILAYFPYLYINCNSIFYFILTTINYIEFLQFFARSIFDIFFLKFFPYSLIHVRTNC